MRSALRPWMPLALWASVGALAGCGDGGGAGGGGGPLEPMALSSEARLALDESLQDAYRTYHTYTVVIGDFGAVEPFAAIVATELDYIDMLGELYVRRGLAQPASSWNDTNVPRFANLQEACTAAEGGEVATELMFERHLRMNLPNDLRQTFQMQRTMARNQHRLAFRNCVGGGIVPADPTALSSIGQAIQDEYRAFFTYARVLDDLGNVAPFANIRDAEWMHVGALANLYVKRGLAVPASDWSLANVPRFTTRVSACDAAVIGESNNIAMYDALLLLALPADVENVFANLRAASLERHRPAFEACGS